MSAPALLLPYQQRWVADNAAVRVWEKSRRIGASYADAAESALTAASKPEAGGMDCFYIAYEKEMTQQYIEDCAFWAKQYNLAASQIESEVLLDEDKDIQVYRIRFASGHKIEALSSQPRNLRSKQGKVTIDEGAFHDDLNAVMEAAFAFLIWGGRVAVISTYNGVDEPYYDLVQDIRAGRQAYSLHRTTLDDAIADGLYRRICLVRGITWTSEGEAAWRQGIIDTYRQREDADQELFCIPKKSGGSYFPRALVEARMEAGIPVLRLELDDAFAQRSDEVRAGHVRDWLEEHVDPLLEALPKNLRHCYGMDFARSAHLSVLAPLSIEQSLHRRAPFAVELKNVPFRQQEQLVFHVADRLPGFFSGAHDSRGNGQYLGEVAAQRYGSERIHQVMLSQPWYQEHMPKYKAAIEDAFLTLPMDADVLADHRAVKVVRGVPMVPATVEKGQALSGRHGDAAIAYCLAWFASEQDFVPVEYATAERGRPAALEGFLGGAGGFLRAGRAGRYGGV